MSFYINTSKLYKTQWIAHYKTGFGSSKIVYGESEHEAKMNALALYRKNHTSLDFKPVDQVVEYVECIG